MSASYVQAAEWRLVKGLETAVEYTRLETQSTASRGDETESNTTVAPFVSLLSVGRLTSFKLDARVVANKSSLSGESDVRPILSANSSTFSSSKRLRFDLGASVEQRAVNSPFAEDDTLFSPSSREQVFTGTAAQLYKQRFGSTRIGASYSVGAIKSSETSDSGSVVQTFSFQSKTPLKIPKLGVGTIVNAQHTAFESAPSVVSGNVSMFATYALSRKLRGIALVGREVIDVDDEIVERTGSNWGLGIIWEPGNRLVFEATYLERNFGRQPRLAVSLNGRRSSVNLAWTRSLSILAASENSVQILDQAEIDNEGNFDSTPVDTNTVDENLLTLPFFQESRNINENVTLSYKLNGRLSVFTASVSRVNQDNLFSDTRLESTLLNLTLSRDVSRSSKITLRLGAGETDTSQGTDEESRRRIGVRWNYIF